MKIIARQILLFHSFLLHVHVMYISARGLCSGTSDCLVLSKELPFYWIPQDGSCKGLPPATFQKSILKNYLNLSNELLADISRRKCSIHLSSQHIITEFMKSNFLKLNPNKTVFLYISRSNPHTNYLPLELNDSTLIHPSKSARNLRVVFDCNLNFRKHISALQKSCFYELKRLTAVRCFIPRNSFESVTQHFKVKNWPSGDYPLLTFKKNSQILSQ